MLWSGGRASRCTCYPSHRNLTAWKGNIQGDSRTGPDGEFQSVDPGPGKSVEASSDVTADGPNGAYRAYFAPATSVQ
jgi:hypothetical protein